MNKVSISPQGGIILIYFTSYLVFALIALGSLEDDYILLWDILNTLQVKISFFILSSLIIFYPTKKYLADLKIKNTKPLVQLALCTVVSLIMANLFPIFLIYKATHFGERINFSRENFQLNENVYKNNEYCLLGEKEKLLVVNPYGCKFNDVVVKKIFFNDKKIYVVVK